MTMSTSKIPYFPLTPDEETQCVMSARSKRSISRWKDIIMAVLLSLNIVLILTIFYNAHLGLGAGRSDSLSLCSML